MKIHLLGDILYKKQIEDNCCIASFISTYDHQRAQKTVLHRSSSYFSEIKSYIIFYNHTKNTHQKQTYLTYNSLE